MNSFLQHKGSSLDQTVQQTWEFLLPGVQEVYRNDTISSERYIQLYTYTLIQITLHSTLRLYFDTI